MRHVLIFKRLLNEDPKHGNENNQLKKKTILEEHVSGDSNKSFLDEA